METFIDKVFGLAESRRFWTAVGGVAVVILHESLGVDQETANWVATIGVGWIVGDSLKHTESFSARRNKAAA